MIKIFLVVISVMVGTASVSAMEPVMVKDTMMKDDMKKEMMMPEMNMGMGAKGDKVAMLQEMLIQKGFLVLPEGVAKGRFGPATKRALMQYQKSLGVSPTGYYGMKTREKMKMMGDGAMMKEKMMEKKEMMKDDVMKKEVMMKGSYEAYSAEKLAALSQKGTVVVFFHAPWCPLCRATDADIVANMSKIPDGVFILKADYDTETALKVKYGVTSQSTFVVVGKDMMKKKMWTGQSTLAEIIAAAK